MNLPGKLVHGDSLARLFVLWNDLIDYLASTRIVSGGGMAVDRRSSGIVIRNIRRSGTTVQSTGGGYDGPFAVSIITDSDGTKMVNALSGVYIINNTLYRCSNPTTCAAAPGLVCLHTVFGSPALLECIMWDDSRTSLTDVPDGWTSTDAYFPLALIGDDYSIQQLCWGVPRFLFFGRCDE